MRALLNLFMREEQSPQVAAGTATVKMPELSASESVAFEKCAICMKILPRDLWISERARGTERERSAVIAGILFAYPANFFSIRGGGAVAH